MGIKYTCNYVIALAFRDPLLVNMCIEVIYFNVLLLSDYFVQRIQKAINL